MLDVDKIQKAIEEQAMKKIQEALIRGVNVAVESTPSDSGHLKGQWQVVKKGNPLMEYPNDPGGARTKLRAKTVIESMTIEDDITIGNNAEYATIINDGTQDIRGSHMLEKAVLSIRRNLK